MVNYRVIKRDGTEVPYDNDKIFSAIEKASKRVSQRVDDDTLLEINGEVVSRFRDNKMNIEDIQETIIDTLHTRGYHSVANTYEDYKHKRDVARESRTKNIKLLKKISSVVTDNHSNENANMAAHTPSGMMMKAASPNTQEFALNHLISPEFAKAHRDGLIHIHDVDYYFTKTTTCVQYDLDELFKDKFVTREGSARAPKKIGSFADLAGIVFQSNQNEQHGGQAIPAFDFMMAPGVIHSFRKNILRYLAYDYHMIDLKIRESVASMFNTIGSEEVVDTIMKVIEKYPTVFLGECIGLRKVVENAISDTEEDTFQAMESFIHDMNMMHSRGGNQVVFSSINYGTDTSPEGRLVLRMILDATEKGLGSGETPIFPIQIFKMKNGVSYDDDLMVQVIASLERGEDQLPDEVYNRMLEVAPNMDLFIKACFVSSRRLFPNFLNLDAPFNVNPLWNKDDPRRWYHETATMGCRTRVYENRNGDCTPVGRGNLSFTTVNLVRLAIDAKGDVSTFLSSVKDVSMMICEQLHERYQYQRTALARQFPFMMRNNLWKGGKDLGPDDEVGDLLLQGTLGLGFIGGHNAMVALTGKAHHESQESYDILIRAVEVMNEVAEKYKEKYGLNYSVLATPAEGLSGRFTAIDKEKYGVLEGVNDRSYYVNSYHVDVKAKVSSRRKIDLEVPFHALTKAGHITYTEFDGAAKNNPVAYLEEVRYMKNSGGGYFSINVPIDRCMDCGHEDVINEECPVCGSRNISRTRRITGYIVGSIDVWNSYKAEEEQDRVKHSLIFEGDELHENI